MARASSPPIREEWSAWLQMGTPSLCSTPAAFAGDRLSSTIMCSTRHHNRESLPRFPGKPWRRHTQRIIRARPRGQRCDSPRGILSKPTRPSRRLCGFCLISFSAQDKSRTFVGRSHFREMSFYEDCPTSHTISISRFRQTMSINCTPSS